MSVRAGQFLSLTGPSGSGKSSLLYALAGLVEPTAGSVSFCGTDLGSMSGERRAELRRECFGFVFQSAELLPELTIAENVALPMELRGIRSSVAAGAARELLARLGISDLAQRRPSQVSGGQAQRAAVARAMVNEPAVLFADEPTGALDEANGMAVVDALQQLTRQHHTALILVTHDSELAARGDEQISLRNGRLVGREHHPLDLANQADLSAFPP